MEPAGDDKDFEFRVAFNGQDEVFRLPPSVSLGELSSLLYASFAALPATQKVLLRSASRLKRGDVEAPNRRAAGEFRGGAQGKAQEKTKGAVLTLADPITAAMTLRQAGITQGSCLLLLGATDADLTAVAELSKDDRTLRGFQEEAEREEQRQGAHGGLSSTAFRLAPGGYGFEEFKVLQPGDVGLTELHPSPEDALGILHALAADWGIRAVMKKYKWRVGLMSEMPPIGLVGISHRCVLGYNVNRGQEISLRLRTDDLKGFRKLPAIRSTLLHELAHMVHDEHDNHFKAFNSQLVREASVGASGLSLLGSIKPPFFSTATPTPPQAHTLPAQAAARPRDPRTAAAEAALARLQQSQAPDSSQASALERGGRGASLAQSLPAEHEVLETQCSLAHSSAPEEAAGGEQRTAEAPAAEMDAIVDGNGVSLGLGGRGVENEQEQAALELHTHLGGDAWAGSNAVVPASAAAVEVESAVVGEAGRDAPDECPADLRAVAGTSLELERRLRGQLQQLWEEHGHSRAGMQNTVSTLRTILRNVLENPTEPRFRSIRKGSKVFDGTVGRFPAALEFLRIVGFSEAVMGQGAPALLCSTVDPGLFWLACSTVDALQSSESWCDMAF